MVHGIRDGGRRANTCNLAHPFGAIELPKMNEARDAVNASAAIVEAVAAGELTPAEAAELSKVVDSYARILQAAEFEERLAKLEEAVARR
jgi:hypothetical protein